MPTFVWTDKCDGCKGAGVAACMYICPHDLMKLDAERMKAYNQEPEQCWECLCCAKACPRQAIEVRPGADYVPMGGATIPVRTDSAIKWTIRFRDGEVKHFEFPSRTTPVGSIDPYGGKPAAGNLNDQRFFTEGGKTLPTI
ncbi:MAG: adenylyl-sulfate reductase subunit beta [Alphaproteobacteria bacterium]|nr:adenylyl-sulfate reductase subunit beta [Alphaproteobacteria bacterium]